MGKVKGIPLPDVRADHQAIVVDILQKHVPEREVLQETEAMLERVWNTLTPTHLPEGEGLG